MVQVWVRLGTVVSLTLAAATLPVSARSLPGASRDAVPNPEPAAPADTPVPVPPPAPADDETAGGGPVHQPADPQARPSVPVLQIAPNSDGSEAGATRALDGGSGPTAVAGLPGGQRGLPVLSTADLPSLTPGGQTWAPARRAWLVCRYPNAPPLGR